MQETRVQSLENFMDREAWGATVHGVVESQRIRHNWATNTHTQEKISISGSQPQARIRHNWATHTHRHTHTHTHTRKDLDLLSPGHYCPLESSGTHARTHTHTPGTIDLLSSGHYCPLESSGAHTHTHTHTHPGSDTTEQHTHTETHTHTHTHTPHTRKDLDQWFSAPGTIALLPFRVIWQCLGAFWVVTTEGEMLLPSSGERSAIQFNILECTGQQPTVKNYLVPVEKLWSRVKSIVFSKWFQHVNFESNK